MHAVVAGVTITDEANPGEVTSYLREQLVPTVSQMPGFDAAREASGQIRPAPGVRLGTADVGEVVAHA